MELNRVVIENFRSIERAEISFEPQCRILVGKNEVGKSNVLAACGLLDRDATVSPSDLREARDDEPPVKEGSVDFVFRLSAADIESAKAALEARTIGSNNPAVKFKGQKFSLDEYVGLFNEWLYIVDIPSGDRRTALWAKPGHEIESNWLIAKPGSDKTNEIELSDGSKTTLSEISLAHVSAISASSRSLFAQATINNLRFHIRKAIDSVVATSLPNCLFWSYAERNILPQSVDIESFKSDPKTCEPLRAMFMLAGETDPAAAIRDAQDKPNALKNLLTRVARKTTLHVKDRWKEIGGVEIVLSPNGAQIDAAVKDHYNEYSFSRRSDGFKRFVSFLILVSARSAADDLSKVLFIQDEPDLGLHPSGVKSLLSELIELANRNYVLVSTHSIFMVDKERIDRHVVVTKSNESTKLLGVDRSTLLDEEVLFNALGYSIFELIKPINILFEGWRDKRLFSVAIKRKGSPEKFMRERLKKDVGLTHVMGVKEVSKFVGYLDAMDRKSIVVTDSDKVAVERQKAFDADPANHNWYRYDELMGVDSVLTAEDFIYPGRLSSCFKEMLENNGFQIADSLPQFEGCAQGVMSSASEYLKGIGLSAETQKDLLNRWKSQVFDSIDTSHILPQYSVVVGNIAGKLGFIPE